MGWKPIFAATITLAILGCQAERPTYIYEFPSGYSGPYEIRLRAGARPLTERQGQLLVRFDTDGKLEVNARDFEALGKLATLDYRYADGTPIRILIGDETSKMIARGTPCVRRNGREGTLKSQTTDGTEVDLHKDWDWGYVWANGY